MRARPPPRARLAWRLLGGKFVRTTAVTRRALVYAMGAPPALTHAPDAVNAYSLHCRCGRGARLLRAMGALGLQARMWARMRSSAHLTSASARAAHMFSQPFLRFPRKSN